VTHPELELSPDALYGIAQLALDGLEGIRPVNPPARVGEFLTGRRAKGIAIERDAGGVNIALTVSVVYGAPIPRVAKAAQKAVREAVTSMTGFVVRSVGVFVESIDLPDQGAPARG